MFRITGRMMATAIAAVAFTAAAADSTDADAKKAAFDITLVTGDRVEAIIKKAFATPPDVITLTRKAMGR